MAVTLYRQIGKGKARRYQKVNLGRGRRPAGLTGPYFLRYSLADGTRPWEAVGDDLDSAIDAQKRKQAYFEALDANVPVVQDQDESGRTKITDALYQWFAELQLFQGKDQQGKSTASPVVGHPETMMPTCGFRVARNLLSQRPTILSPRISLHPKKPQYFQGELIRQRHFRVNHLRRTKQKFLCSYFMASNSSSMLGFFRRRIVPGQYLPNVDSCGSRLAYAA